MFKPIKLFMELINLFFKEFFKRILSWAGFIFLLLAIYEFAIKQHFSPKYQKAIYMSAEIALIIAICFILLASVKTYHKLRMKGEKDFYSIMNLA
jgi:uncharacterized membrane protein